MRDLLLALTSMAFMLAALAVVAIWGHHSRALGYSFEDRTQLQMLVDACRTGHHLCDFR